MRVLRPLERFLGVFEGLLRELVPGQVVAFAMLRSRGPVGVRGKLVKLGCSLVRVIWHVFLP